jgi:hypothetical protein
MARLSRSTPAGRRQASRAADAAQKLPVNSVRPRSPATPAGRTLTCSTGTWSNTPDIYSYQWRRDGSAIIGATGNHPRCCAGRRRRRDDLHGDAVNSGVPAVATSAATAAVLGYPTFSVQPTITGTAQEGRP